MSSTSRGFLDTQIKNRNFLAPTGFKFTLTRTPKVAFFSNSSVVPGISLGVANQPTYLKDIDIPGDKLNFDDFTLRFLVDENLENYMEIQNWMRGLGFPENLAEIYDLQNEQKNINTRESKLMNIYSDGTLLALNSSNNTQFKVIFKDLFPINLSQLEFDATDTGVEYFTAEATFKYTLYNIFDKKDRRL
jgi:hypothetical protein